MPSGPAVHPGTVLYTDLDVKSNYFQGACVGKGSVMWAARASPNLHAVFHRVPWTPVCAFTCFCLYPSNSCFGFSGRTCCHQLPLLLFPQEGRPGGNKRTRQEIKMASLMPVYLLTKYNSVLAYLLRTQERQAIASSPRQAGFWIYPHMKTWPEVV